MKLSLLHLLFPRLQHILWMQQARLFPNGLNYVKD